MPSPVLSQSSLLFPMLECTEEGGLAPECAGQSEATLEGGPAWDTDTWSDSLDLDRRLFHPREVYVLHFIH